MIMTTKTVAQLDREIEEVLHKASVRLKEDGQKPWYFEKTGPAFFNKWSLTHVGWGAVFQLFFPNRHLAGLVVHTIYESIEGYIFPAAFRDVSMRNHVGDTIAFAAGMSLIPRGRSLVCAARQADHRSMTKCKNCGATKPATHSRAGRPLPDAQWYINTAGAIVCSPYCAGFVGGQDWKSLQQ